MDNLKSIFERAKFGLKDIPSGHETRFLDKLDNELPKISKSKKFILPILGYAVAASIGIVLFLSIVKTTNNSQLGESIILISETAETVEAEVYLQNQVVTRMETIHQLDKRKKHTADIIDDILEFDNSLSRLKSDLKEAPGDQRIVDAVLNTYIMKIEALDNIVNILKNIS